MDVELLQFLETSAHECPAERRMTTDLAGLRGELRETEAALRREVHAMRAALRDDLQDQRAELLKWGLLYWIGQAAATAAIVAGLLLVLFG